MPMMKRLKSIKKAFRGKPPFGMAELEKNIGDYTLTSQILEEYTKLLGSDNIDKVAKELQLETAWTQVQARTSGRADDVMRLTAYLELQQSKDHKASNISTYKVDKLKAALHQLQLDEQKMASICKLTKLKL